MHAAQNVFVVLLAAVGTAALAPGASFNFFGLENVPSPIRPTVADAADMDGDGLVDIVALDMFNPALCVFRSSATGSFKEPVTTDLGWIARFIDPRLIFGDIAADAYRDVVLGLFGARPPVHAFLGIGDGAFSNVSQDINFPGTFIAAMGFPDLNGDGFDDCVASMVPPVSFYAALGDGEGGFEIVWQEAGQLLAFAFGDFNGDGALDLGVVGGCAYVLLNRQGATSTFQRGDVNADAKRDVADAVYTHNYLFARRARGREPGCMDAANANDSGKIDLADAITILSHLFGGIGPLPEPFAECGGDPTGADALGCTESRSCAGGG